MSAVSTQSGAWAKGRAQTGPVFSCVMTMFNEGPLLRRAAASVLGQSHAALELILVDDGADDATRAIAQEIAADDRRVRLIRQANAGLSAARNRGLEHVRGDYVCFLDADDARPPWAFAAAAEVIRRDAPDLALQRGVLSEVDGDMRRFYDAAHFDRLRELLGENPIETGAAEESMARALAHLIEPQAANKFVRVDFLRARRLGFPNGRVFEDMLFHAMAVAQAARISIIHAPGFAYHRRYGRPQITSSSDERRFDAIAVARMTFALLERTPSFADPLRRSAAAAAALRIVRWCESCVGHQHRWNFRMAVRAAMRGVDPRWSVIAADTPLARAELDALRRYAKEVFA